MMNPCRYEVEETPIAQELEAREAVVDGPVGDHGGRPERLNSSLLLSHQLSGICEPFVLYAQDPVLRD